MSNAEQSSPSEKLTTEKVDGKIIDELITNGGFQVTDALRHEVDMFIHRTRHTVAIFSPLRHPKNDNYIDEYNKKIAVLMAYTEGKQSNVTSITLHTQKGDVIFYHDAGTRALFRALLGGPPPEKSTFTDQDKEGFIENAKYLKSDEIILPIKPINMDGRGTVGDGREKMKLIYLIAEEAKPLVHLLMENKTVSKKLKGDIKKLMLSLIEEFFPDVSADPIEDKTFRNHLFSAIGN